MERTMHNTVIAACALALGACATTSAATLQGPTATGDTVRASDVGFLVLAPDRGFLGNEEIADAVAELGREHHAAFVPVTDERTRETLDDAVNELRARGARRFVALPFFITTSHPRFVLARRALDELRASGVDVEIARAFGESYFAVELLADHLRAIERREGRALLVLGYGATSPDEQRAMGGELARIAERAADGLGFASVSARAWPVRGSDATAPALEELAPGTLVMPFHLGEKLDGMMRVTAMMRMRAPPAAELADVDVTPHATVALWMRREAARHAPPEAHEVGAVVLAHGRDFHWNETIRRAVDPLARERPVELAFCMADQPVVERAIRRLEQRGVRAIVIVRVFGLASSFEPEVERMIGLDVEGGERRRQAHGAHHGHHHGAPAGPPPPRIWTSALVTTVGGLEDHALFAHALAERALELSREPERETVFLVAHGAGEDWRNRHWVGVLESLARQMGANGAGAFRAIHVGTWREDWPSVRDPEVARLRGLVEEATRDGGRALVIPARTNDVGPERELLAGLEFELGTGFAPHPLFARWVEEQVRRGLQRLRGPGGARSSEPALAARR